MTSQTDLDQGGTYRQFTRRFLGPSVGWVWTPQDNILAVTAAGTYTAVEGTTLVTVNVAGAVTINVPYAHPTDIVAGARPGDYLALPFTVVDIGGNALAHNITIQPQGSETLMGLSSVTIRVNYGSLTLIPDYNNSLWFQAPG